jgi:hypothetical protein
MSAHATHCCRIHFCKYYPDGSKCPVKTGEEVQMYPCEVCTYEGDDGGINLEPGEVVYTLKIVARRAPDNEVEGMQWLPNPTDVRDAFLPAVERINADSGWNVRALKIPGEDYEDSDD